VFNINTATKETITVCPTEACGWEITRLAYQQRWSKKRIWGENTLTAFKDFVDPERKAAWCATKDRMMQRRKGK
jgi:hypothetical protein